MYWIYTLFPVVKLSYFPQGLNYTLICDSGKWLSACILFFFRRQNRCHWIICEKAVVQAHLLTSTHVRISKTADEISSRFCFCVHFIWLTRNISFSRDLLERALICLQAGFLIMFLFTTALLCLSDTCHFASECGWTLSSRKLRARVLFSQWKERSILKKREPVSQGSVSGIMPAYCTPKWKWTFMEWVTSWTASSLGHNEEIVEGADMVWKLCDKEECPKFKWFIKLLFVLCVNGPICWKTTKNFAWISIRVSSELCVGLCWVNWSDSGSLAQFPHWRQSEATVEDFNDWNVPLMSGMNNIMFHNFTVASSWFGECCTAGEQLGRLY